MDSSRNNTEPLPNPPALQSPVGSLSSLSSFVTFVVICLVKWHTRSQWRGLRKGEHSGVAWKRQSRVTVPPSAKKKKTCKNVLWLRTSTLAYMFAHKLVFPSGVGDHATALGYLPLGRSRSLESWITCIEDISCCDCLILFCIFFVYPRPSWILKTTLFYFDLFFDISLQLSQCSLAPCLLIT